VRSNKLTISDFTIAANNNNLKSNWASDFISRSK